MRLGDVYAGIEPVVLLSTAFAFGSTLWAARRPLEPVPVRGALQEPIAHPLRESAVRWLCHQLLLLGMVVALLCVNQIVFNAYVVRVHHGNPDFIQRYIGHGWFVLDRHNVLVQWIARHSGDGRVLAPSVLRVQAFLELPFVL